MADGYFETGKSLHLSNGSIYHRETWYRILIDIDPIYSIGG